MIFDLYDIVGLVMSLLSKLLPKRLASGTLNAGLLATESGTFGEFIPHTSTIHISTIDLYS